MSERRPHWDDDLLYSVKRCMNAPAPLTDDDRTYNIIAAVEDWRNSNIQVHWQGMTATERNLSEALGREQRGRDELEAAIARVQALAEQASPVISRGCSCPGNDCTGTCRRGEPLGWDLDPAEVLRALGGDSDA